MYFTELQITRVSASVLTTKKYCSLPILLWHKSLGGQQNKGQEEEKGIGDKQYRLYRTTRYLVLFTKKIVFIT